MTKQNNGKLNSLERDLPEGLLVDAAWLSAHGYSTSLRSQYVTSGWLAQPVRRVYRRPRGPVSWEQVVISLQMMLKKPLVVGGRTALELQGFAHYLSGSAREVHLYGPQRPPTWLNTSLVDALFVYHNDSPLFRKLVVPDPDAANTKSHEPTGTIPINESLAPRTWGQWNWPMIVSIPERAIFELLYELPKHESFELADKFMQSLSNLSPKKLQTLLVDCQNVKVKRLFFFFADRHKHAWLKHLNRSAIDLGRGKRMLVKGGKLDPLYQITVPEAFYDNP
jgi:hypothetical protein